MAGTAPAGVDDRRDGPRACPARPRSRPGRCHGDGIARLGADSVPPGLRGTCALCRALSSSIRTTGRSSTLPPSPISLRATWMRSSPAACEPCSSAPAPPTPTLVSNISPRHISTRDGSKKRRSGLNARSTSRKTSCSAASSWRRAYAHLGRIDEARAEMTVALALRPDFTIARLSKTIQCVSPSGRSSGLMGCAWPGCPRADGRVLEVFHSFSL